MDWFIIAQSGVAALLAVNVYLLLDVKKAIIEMGKKMNAQNSKTKQQMMGIR